MQTETAMKAVRVPALASEAIWSSGARPASSATAVAVISVICTGVPVAGCTLARLCGSRPSRAMTKKIRLWPYRKAKITVGMAITAAAPIILAASPWPSWRRISASGSGLPTKLA